VHYQVAKKTEKDPNDTWLAYSFGKFWDEASGKYVIGESCARGVCDATSFCCFWWCLVVRRSTIS